MSLKAALDELEDECAKLQFICDVSHAIGVHDCLTPAGEDGFYLILFDSRSRIEEASDRIRKILFGP